MRRLVPAIGLATLASLALPLAWARPLYHTIPRVPFVKQEPKWCGPAALESVLRYHRVNVDQRTIAQEIALPDGTVLNLDLKLYARRRGLLAVSSRGDRDSLKQWIARDVPVICQLRAGGIGRRQNHFVVVFGYDDRKFTLTAHTGTRAAEEIPALDFTREWRDADNWMLVIRRRETAGPAAQPETSDASPADQPPQPDASAATAPDTQSGK